MDDHHRRMPWHSQDLDEVFRVLETSEEGLSDAEAQRRLEANGYNRLRSKPPKTIFRDC